MPFIGNQPALSYTSFAKQDFTTSATTSYTLDNPVANANELALFINFVRQEPTTAYSASGTTLTLTEATSVGDDMYCVFLGKAVQTVNPPNASVGASQIVDASITSGKLFSGFANGITEADQWRLTSDITGTNAVISSNLERVDDASFSKIGTGMSVSSGIWSFPSTGLYQIIVKMSGFAPSQDNFYVITEATIDNSSYDRLGSVGASADNSYENGQSETLFINVTNISNVKVRFQTLSLAGSTAVIGVTDYNRTSFTFIRLGDSQ